jgi:hypothetical protein
MAIEPDAALTGAAYDLAHAGFTPMPDPHEKDEGEVIGSDSASLREAAARRSCPSDEIAGRAYVDDNGEPVAANVAVTLDRAGRDYASAKAADQFAAENESSRALAARVDAMRAEAWARDPGAAEWLGFEPPPIKADNSEASTTASERTGTEPADPAVDPGTDGLDPEIAKVLNHPQVLQAIEERIGEAEKARQSYVNGLAAATEAARVSFLSQFPELASVAPESLPGALEQMSRQDPAKFARVQAMVETSDQLLAQRQREGHRQAEIARQNFQRFAKSEDARLETMLKDESKETQRAVSAEILASAAASGIGASEMMRLFNSEPLMRNAVPGRSVQTPPGVVGQTPPPVKQDGDGLI